MTVVSYRLYCTDCTNDKVVREDRMDDHPWKVVSKSKNEGLCPACNQAVDASDEYSRDHEEVPFEDLDNIGASGAENLRDEGIITRQDVQNASDEDILDVSWIGQGGLESIRQEVQ